MNLRTQIDLYYEEMLKLQYEASSGIEHKLTKGELREKFLKNFFMTELSGLNVSDGILTIGDWQSSQGDFIVLKGNARLGAMNIFDVEDCMIFMEIKSNAAKNEYVLLNEHAKELKEKNSNISVGMFSYTSKAKRKNVVTQFGFAYDKSLDMYEDYDNHLDAYPMIDFYFNLNINKTDVSEMPYFIIKNTDGQKILYMQPPVIANLINVFKGTII